MSASYAGIFYLLTVVFLAVISCPVVHYWCATNADCKLADWQVNEENFIVEIAVTESLSLKFKSFKSLVQGQGICQSILQQCLLHLSASLQSAFAAHWLFTGRDTQKLLVASFIVKLILFYHAPIFLCCQDNLKHGRSQENDETFFLWAMRQKQNYPP